MHAWASSTRLLLAAGATLVAAMGLAAGAAAAPGSGNNPPVPPGQLAVKDIGPDYLQGKQLTVQVRPDQPVPGTQHSKNARVGEQRVWLALDDTDGLYVKTYTLRGVGRNIEIWVANDLTFPAGDCRNSVADGVLVTVTDAQVQRFVQEFDTVIYPRESAAFSVPPSRDGSRAVLDDILRDKTASKKKGEAKVPSSYYLGDGSKVVTLVDNVRDANFHEPETPDGQTYIAGFFSSQISGLLDRNVMTIDAYDWLHRTGVTPPDDSAAQEYQDCAAASGRANPYLYEATFAHEYQHLLHSDVDPDETTWLNEGLSDWAQTLTGYVNPNLPPTDANADSHIACFQGFLDESYGGPENSLTQWGDQGDPEILCDYGAAYSFMEYLHGRFGGDALMSALHRSPDNGFAALQAALDARGAGASSQDVLHDWLAAMALDEAVAGGAAVPGVDPGVLSAPTLRSLINWTNPQSYGSPGAPPNGGDFVPLAGGEQLRFTGSASYPAEPLAWTAGPERLFSGVGDDLDRGIVFTGVTVPDDDPTLRVSMEWGTEQYWDYAFVQVWDTARQRWISLPDGQGFATSDHDPGAIAAVVANLPGFTGPSPDGDVASGPQSLTFDLAAYVGQSVDIAFRYVTDPAVTGLGFWVDEASVGGTPLTDGTTTAGAVSRTEAHPVPVDGWTVQLVGHDGSVGLRQRVSLTQQPDGSWVGRAAVPSLSTVGAIVTADDPSEGAGQYPTYTLGLDGSAQP